LETQELRKIYHRTERLTLVILLISLPAFGVVYLYHNSGNLSTNLPELPGFLNGFLITFSLVLLGVQYWAFHQKIKLTFSQSDLLVKVTTYSKATSQRFLYLFLVSVGSTVGLLLSQNPVYIVIFALALVFFSLAKPSPDRMARLMKLKKEERELLREISRPE
jgi:protein-S-isoprenylcysteine O-methyltransferase Ste14